ncbi:tolloid-like protein 2 [Oculina patagonica]
MEAHGRVLVLLCTIYILKLACLRSIVFASSACLPPGDFLRGTSGFFSSPNFPNNFPANSNCTWNITVPTGRIIKVTFFNFTLEPNQNSACIGESQGARVFITNVASDNGAQDFKICGQNLPAPVYSVGNSILVRLRSLSNVYSGFKASYEAIDGGLLCPRGITLTERSGVITSPFYPRMYPGSQNCSWQITAPQGNRVKLEIAITLNIQQCGPQPDCTCDYLQVQNGFSADHNGNEKICGAPSKTITYYSTHESLKVLFVSDDTQSKQYDGFEATYTQLNYSPPTCLPPGDFLRGTSGFFSSPNFPNNFPANSNCTWNITVPTGRIIKVTFFNFTLEPNQNSACIGESQGARVFITNVASDNGAQDFKICGQNLPAPVYSVGNSILVRLRSLSNVYSGFKASYEAIDGGLLCPRGITLTEASGVITSPFYPRMYPDNQNCSWQITAPQGNRVKLEIAITLNIKQCGPQPDCTCDYLQVQNGFSADHNGNEKICGAPSKTITYYSTHESLKVLFVSDDDRPKQYDGFEATYTQLNYTPPSK